MINYNGENMAIEILQANDNNPPKVSILPKVQMTKYKKWYLYAVLALWFIITLIDTFKTNKGFFSILMSNFFFFFLLQIPVAFVWIFVSKFKMMATAGNSAKAVNSHIHEYYKKVFMEKGYEVNHENQGIVIDEKRKKIGFTVSPVGMVEGSKALTKMLVCDFSDVRRWYISSKDIKHPQGGIAFTMYTINVEIAYPASPMQMFDAKNEFDAQQWIAKLTSLINN